MEAVKKGPALFSPKWFCMVIACFFSVAFWKGLKSPEAQAYWQASTAATLLNVGLIASIGAWCEVHAPWVLTIVSALGAALKAIWAFVVAVSLAVWNISTNS